MIDVALGVEVWVVELCPFCDGRGAGDVPCVGGSGDASGPIGDCCCVGGFEVVVVPESGTVAARGVE